MYHYKNKLTWNSSDCKVYQINSWGFFLCLNQDKKFPERSFFFFRNERSLAIRASGIIMHWQWPTDLLLTPAAFRTGNDDPPARTLPR